MVADVADPFAPPTTAFARLGARLGCTEGQTWSLAIGTAVTVLVLGVALPDVAWRPDATSAAVALAPPEATVAPDSAPSAGFVAPAVTEPVTVPPAMTPRPSVPPAPPASAPPAQVPDAPPPSSVPEETATTSAPVRVVDGGYASATAGTPIGNPGVPAGSLAVALRAGQVDKVAFVRLDGDGTVLELALDATPGANVLEPLAGLRLCPVLEDGWDVGDGDTSLGDAPAYDCTSAVAGERSAAGDRWTFDLTAVDDAARSEGFAIVPDAAAASPTYQVVLLQDTPDEERE